MKVNLETLPARMKNLKFVERDGVSIPVPWFVAWPTPEAPEFRAMDGDKYIASVRKKLCWVCGEKLGINVCFVAGPMCGINRTSSEPPSHAECARWSAINCPFLANPKMVRREDEVMNNARLRDEAPGICITRNPGVAMLWFTRQYEVFDDGKGQPLITMGEPESVEWYREGRLATREEVQESIDTGVPNLMAIAKQQRGAVDALSRAIDRFNKYLPEASQETSHATPLV